MASKLQNGSAHVVIITILVIALIGSLGWIFWQNVAQQKDKQDESSKSTQASSDNKDSDQQAEANLVEAKNNNVFKEKISFSYPETWTMTRDHQTPEIWSYALGKTVVGDNERIKITSPSGKYTVEYYIESPSVADGTCDPQGTGTIAEVSRKNLKGFADTSLIDFVSNETDGRHKGASYLVDASVALQLTSGSSLCSTGIRLMYLGQQTYVSAYIRPKALEEQDKEGGFAQIDTVKDALSGEEYEQAKAILLSTKH